MGSQKVDIIPLIILGLIFCVGCVLIVFLVTESKKIEKNKEETKEEEKTEEMITSGITSISRGTYSLSIVSIDTGGMDPELQEKEKNEYMHGYEGVTTTGGCKDISGKEIHTFTNGDTFTIECPSDTTKHSYYINNNKLDIEEDKIISLDNYIINNKEYIFIRAKYFYIFEVETGKLINKIDNAFEEIIFYNKDGNRYFVILDNNEYKYFILNDNTLYKFPYSEKELNTEEGKPSTIWESSTTCTGYVENYYNQGRLCG